MPENIHDQDRFRKAYEGQPPWDIGKPQPVMVDAAEKVTGSILDVGCGTGENALFFAQRGHEVTGIDFLEHPLAEARRKADQRNLPARFLKRDALQLGEFKQRFDSVIDCGLFHVFSDEDRTRYVTQLQQVVTPGGTLFLLCFSDREPPGEGPRRVSKDEIVDAFDTGWDIVSIHQARFETRREATDHSFSPGGPIAWFAEIRRAD